MNNNPLNNAETYLFSILITGVDNETSCKSTFLFQLLVEELFNLLIPFFSGQYIWTCPAKHEATTY
jgi:hypothetical protein